jgi:4'-phosphopantetheinyl transferase
MSIQREDSNELLCAPETPGWQIGPIRATARPGDLHLWRIRTNDRGVDLAARMDLLEEHQQARAARMRHRAHRDRYVRAQAGLREILSRYLDKPPKSIRFIYGSAGKPRLPGASTPLSFNLTTTGDLALVAISAGVGPSAEVGVDCEWIRPRHNIQAVAERMFEVEVVQAINAVPEQERLAHFCRAWTALEADAKTDGRGLFRPRPPGAPRPTIRHCIPEIGYIAAVARERLPAVSEWSAFDLLSEG